MKKIQLSLRGALKGEIAVGPDKSISHRAVILSGIGKGKSRIVNFLDAEDPLRTLEAFRRMSVNVDRQGAEIVIHGQGLAGLKEPDNVIDCGNSGTTCRLLSGLLAGQHFNSFFTGDDSLRNRPMRRVIDPLSMMGASFYSRNGGRLPMMVQGARLKSIQYQSPVASAQVKSSIMLAALSVNGVTTVIEPEKSRDHTERMLKAAGVGVIEHGLAISVEGGTELQPMEWDIPGDFSSAAFFIVAATVIPDSSIILRRVGVNPTRTGALDILRNMGAQISLENEREIGGEPVADIVVAHSPLKGIAVDSRLIVRAIDEFPILCVAAALAQGVTTITGATELRVKECDRIAAMRSELSKMSVAVEELKDGLIIEGIGRLHGGAKVHSYGDHRIAMSLAVASLTTKTETTLDDVDCINTSFPDFFALLDSLTSKR